MAGSRFRITVEMVEALVDVFECLVVAALGEASVDGGVLHGGVGLVEVPDVCGVGAAVSEDEGLDLKAG